LPLLSKKAEHNTTHQLPMPQPFNFFSITSPYITIVKTHQGCIDIISRRIEGGIKGTNNEHYYKGFSQFNLCG